VTSRRSATHEAILAIRAGRFASISDAIASSVAQGGELPAVFVMGMLTFGRGS